MPAERELAEIAVAVAWLPVAMREPGRDPVLERWRHDPGMVTRRVGRSSSGSVRHGLATSKCAHDGGYRTAYGSSQEDGGRSPPSLVRPKMASDGRTARVSRVAAGTAVPRDMLTHF